MGFETQFALTMSGLRHLGAPYPPCVREPNATSWSLRGSYSKIVRLHLIFEKWIEGTKAIHRRAVSRSALRRRLWTLVVVWIH